MHRISERSSFTDSQIGLDHLASCPMVNKHSYKIMRLVIKMFSDQNDPSVRRKVLSAFQRTNWPLFCLLSSLRRRSELLTQFERLFVIHDCVTFHSICACGLIFVCELFVRLLVLLVNLLVGRAQDLKNLKVRERVRTRSPEISNFCHKNKSSRPNEHY